MSGLEAKSKRPVGEPEPVLLYTDLALRSFSLLKGLEDHRTGNDFVQFVLSTRLNGNPFCTDLERQNMQAAINYFCRNSTTEKAGKNALLRPKLLLHQCMIVAKSCTASPRSCTFASFVGFVFRVCSKTMFSTDIFANFLNLYIECADAM